MTTATRERLRAVHDDDLQVVLQGLGIYGDFMGGRLRCANCGDVISSDNLYALYPDSGQVKVSCDRPDCIAEVLARQAERP